MKWNHNKIQPASITRVDKEHCIEKINVKITKSRANFKY